MELLCNYGGALQSTLTGNISFCKLGYDKKMIFRRGLQNALKKITKAKDVSLEALKQHPNGFLRYSHNYCRTIV
jgi:hypothetical protein